MRTRGNSYHKLDIDIYPISAFKNRTTRFISVETLTT